MAKKRSSPGIIHIRTRPVLRWDGGNEWEYPSGNVTTRKATPEELAAFKNAVPAANRTISVHSPTPNLRLDPVRYAPPIMREYILKRDHFTCRYCESPVTNKTANIDHVRPWKLGGRTIESNLVTCCQPCNARKGNQKWQPLKIKQRRRPGKSRQR